MSMRRYVLLSVLLAGFAAAGSPGDLRAWLNYRHVGPKPAEWTPPEGERFWGQDNLLVYERTDGRTSLILNGRETQSVPGVVTVDGRLNETAPEGFEYVGYNEIDRSPSRPDGLRFTAMDFNNPGLDVPLGVGLISFPLVMDYDGDGKRDLLLSCECRRWNSTHFFRNLGKAGDVRPVFGKGRRIAAAGGNTVVTKDASGREIVTTRRWAYDAFREKGFAGGYDLNSLPDFRGGARINENTWRIVDYNGDGRDDWMVSADIFERAWDDAYDAQGVWTGGVNRCQTWVYTNRANSATAWARPFAVPGADGSPLQTGTMAMMEDWDGDGDLDIVGTGPRNGFRFCRNSGTRTAPKFERGAVVMAEDGRPLELDSPLITPSAYDWNGDGRPDIISGDESGCVAYIENTGRTKDGVPVFRKPVYFRQRADWLKCGVLPSIAAVDWDGDGDEDFICGLANGTVAFIENLSGRGVEKPKWAAPVLLSARPPKTRHLHTLAPGKFAEDDFLREQTVDLYRPTASRVICIRAGENGSIQSPGEQMWGYLCISAGDWDGDGLTDLMVGDIRGEIHWYRNAGTRKNPVLEGPYDVEAEWADGRQPAQPWGWMKPEVMANPKAILTQWRCTPVMTDFDGDGLTDLLLVDAEGYLCFWKRGKRMDGTLFLNPPSRVLLNAANGNPIRLNSDRKGKCGRRRLCVGDWDGDGKTDIFIGSENARWWRQVGGENGVWRFENRGELAETLLQWHEASPSICDFDANGIPDMVVTGEDGVFYYLPNPRALLAAAKKSVASAPARTRRNLLVNPSFEGAVRDGLPEGWTLKIYAGTNPYEAKHGFGANGSGGVRYSNSDKATFAALKQRVKVEPGHIYSFECMIRPDGLTCGGEGAVSTVEWHDAKGNRLGGTSVPNSGIRGKTAQFQASRPRRTPRLPDNVASAEISIYVNRDAVGTCFIDDACFWEDSPAPVDALVSDAYRDCAADGEVTFVAGLDLESSAIDPKAVRGIFTIPAAKGGRREIPADRIETFRATATVKVSALAFGEQTVCFRLVDVKGGKTLGTSEMKFTRVRTLPERKVRFDRHGRTIVDGQPFFPLGMYAGEMTEDKIAKFAESDFNCVMPYRMPTRAVMDGCWKRGIRVIYDTRNGVIGWADTEKGLKTDVDELFWLRRKVMEFGTHPALLAWYTNDEFDLSEIGHLTVLHRILAALDPEHPAYTCIYQVPNTRGYLPSFDVIGTDPYPIGDAPISLVTDWTRKTAKGVMGARPLWQVPQAFDWAYYRKKRGGSLEGLRFPTRQEMANMCWQAIAAGANGLVLYAFHDVLRNDPDKADARWEDVKAVAREIREREPVLLATGPVPEIRGETPTIGVRAFNVRDRIRILIVNGDLKPQPAALTVGKRRLSVGLEPLEAKWIDLKD